MALRTAIGGRDTQSFITVSQANSIIGGFFDDADITSWNLLDSGQKEYCLMLAAQLMDYFPWAGRTVYCGQALCFPRRIRDNLICLPCAVQNAQAYLALHVVRRGMANRPTSQTEEETGSRVSQVSLGGLLSVSFSGDPIKAGNVMDKITRSMHFPVYLMVKQYLSQIRGGTILEEDDDEFPTCSTTSSTTTTSTTTTTTSTSTTTTTTT